ncbi:Guanosine-diphosphatase [Entophlyctis sp. JEL0112]|nr:Guanosine-diphosphatase [Entophlyctis sp. JEL0112]
MIDAGSTGSRIHVYKFTHCVDSASHKSLGNLVLDDELFEQLKPGLSSYGGDPIKAAKSLDPLLAKAKARVPVELWACTPIAVKATAGLRLLGVSESDAILKAIRTRLESMYPFNVVSDADNGVAVMDGKDEALFAWITVNYLRNSIGAAAPSDSESVAIMDLGGGSTQIVFEPKAGVTIVQNVEQHVEVTFGGRTYVVYQHSFLGYGLMEGRRKVLQAAIEKLDARLSCLGTGATMEIKNPGDSAGSKAGARVVEGTDEGFHQCQQFVGENLFSKDKTLCEVSTASCSWDGVYMPPLSSSFDGDIYAFSYFYDRIADLGVLPRGNEKEGFEFTISDVESLADAVCAAVDGKTAVLKELPKAVADAVESEPGLCLDLSFIYRMLRTGYELGQSRVLKTAKKINGVETGWCLGAAIHMVDAMIGGSRGVSGVCKAP